MVASPLRRAVVVPMMVLALLPSAAASASDGIVLDLDRLPDDLPYVFDAPLLSERESPDSWRRHVPLDGDRDGFVELVRLVRTGLLSEDFEGGTRFVNWQLNLPPAFTAEEPAARLGEGVDLTRDGFPEILLLADAAAVDRHELWAFDAVEDTVVLRLPLPTGPDLRPDGRWDGNYEITGVVPGPRPFAILQIEVRYDREPRGLMAVDLTTGRTLWRYQMGNNINKYDARLEDLDGDGTPEIVAAGTSPDNLGGREINGTSDDTARLFVIGVDGVLRWSVKVGGVFCTTWVDTGDLDGDGDLEIVTATRTQESGRRDRLCVWNGRDGRLEAQKPLPGPASRVVVNAGARGSIVVGLLETGFQEYRYADGRLAAGARAVAARGVEFVQTAELTDDPGEELVVGTRGGVLAVLNARFEPLMKLEGRREGVTGAHGFALEDGRRALAVDCTETGVWTWSPRPRTWRDAVPVLAFFGGVTSLVGVAAFVRRRRRGRAVPRDLLERERMAKLRGQLAQVSHERLGITQGLERLLTLLDFLVLEESRSDGALDRARATHADLEESGFGRLEEIVALGRGMPGAPGPADRITPLLAEIRTSLVALFAGRLEAAEIERRLPALRGRVTELKRGLNDIRRAAESHVTTDLAKMARRMLLIHEDDFRLGGVDVTADLPDDGSALGRIDATDLRFVLDNLLGNALKAMAGGEAPALELAARVDEETVTLEITDSGDGVDPERAGSLFKGGPSTWAGGGTGLARSRELVAAQGGDLVLGERRPGRGATFVLTLRRQRPELEEEGS